MHVLEGKVLEAKQQYQRTVSSARETTQTLSALPQFLINDQFTLNQDEAWYTLAIEIQSPIETVMLQVCVCVCSLKSLHLCAL